MLRPAGTSGGCKTGVKPYALVVTGQNGSYDEHARLTGVPMRRLLLPLALLTGSAAAFAGLPVGAQIDEAIVVDIAPSALDLVRPILGDIVPPAIPLPGPLFEASDYQDQCLPWPLDDVCFELYSYDIYVSGFDVGTEITDLNIQLGNDVIDFSATATIALASSADPIEIDADASGLGFINLGDSCDAYVDPFSVEIKAGIPLGMNSDGNIQLGRDLDGDGVVDQLFQDVPTLSFNLTGDDINLTNCTVGDIIGGINDVLGFFGLGSFNLYQLILDFALPAVEPLIGDLLTSEDLTQVAIDANAAAAGLTISESVALLDESNPLLIDLYPTDLSVTPDGIRAVLGGGIASARMADCMEPYVNKAESLSTAGTPPALTDAAPADVDFVHDAGVYVDDDFLNQAGYAVWYGGALCFEISEDSGLSLPIPISTTLLSLLAGDAFDEYFPPDQPAKQLSIVTRPNTPPEIGLGGGHDIALDVPSLGLDIYAELDGRMMRPVGLDLGVQAGADVNFDETTGELGVDVALDADSIASKVVFNELNPSADAEIADGIGGIFDTVAGPLLGDALSGLTFPLPGFSLGGLDLGSLVGGPVDTATDTGDLGPAYGMVNLTVTPTGANGDFIGVYASVGEVDYYDPSAGCGGCGGDGSTSGGCGCDSSVLPARSMFVLFPLVLAFLRRRRE